MLLLTSTSDKIQVITGTAVTVDCHASYVDYDGTDVTTGRNNEKITTATTTDIVDPPAGSTTRNVKTLHICNIHASSSVLTTVQHTDGTNVIKLEEITLLAGERLSYVEGQGFELVDVNGITKTNAAASVFVTKLAADQSNSTTTLTNVTGLETPVGVGTWMFEYYLLVQSAATTTGHRFSVNHDGTLTSFVAWLTYSSALGTASDANADQDIVTAAGGLLPVMAARAKSTTGWGFTITADTANADVFYMIQGILVCTVAGNIELYHGSEVAAASTVKGGSSLRLTKTG